MITAAAVLAAELKHPLQDCLYLAEARRLDAPLLTADRAFRDRVAGFDSRVTLLTGDYAAAVPEERKHRLPASENRE